MKLCPTHKKQTEFGSSAPCKSQTTVCNESSPSQCGTDEFLSETFCCQLCPAGTHLIKSCQRNHSKSECVPCELENFMNYNNRESSCFRCSQCRDDQEEVSECSQTADRKCQCKQGAYCNSENCVEKCLPCSSCPKDKVIRQCNATMDTLCDTFESNSGTPGYHHLCLSGPLTVIVVIAAVIIIIAAIIAVIWCVLKRVFSSSTAPGSLNSPRVPGEEIQLSSNMLQNSHE
ncbi:tumor necrosis factor receptor superfamily member 26-like isoform X3 [Peromyscus leucopus]|uniref:tumor necrosis factor receptor superfamily member 26-like isoform X3 n=1 Tax=Peromyscus leucopus TaxID=10041 RepID=UPI001884EEEF|nr:tumor necrosis factor receptor superfamily member 26-like isoform X3 [Peromyscus leucopus]